MMRVLAALLLMFPASATIGGEDTRFAASRAIAAQFQQTLGARLQGALGEGGTVAAITVCSEEAPAIAAELGTEHGVTVARRTDRPRNPANAADTDDLALLAGFASALAHDPATPSEDFAIQNDGSARYARAILIQPPCLACHGPALAADTVAALRAHYPDDRATGYALGALRGLVRIDWPAPLTAP